MNEANLLWALAAGLSAGIVFVYTAGFWRRLVAVRERKVEAALLGIDKPTAQYPFVDATKCIGCGACVEACPEGDPLGVVGGTAVVINGLRCVGHSHCELACPVGAIEVGLGDLKDRKDIPQVDETHQTSALGLYIAGELGGLALVKNACNQGQRTAEAIIQSLEEEGRPAGPTSADTLDLVVVGAGPAGLSAGLAAAAAGLRYVVLEREPNLGGSLLHYPRRKMVLTQPVELGTWGRLSRSEYSKEDLLDLFGRMVEEIDLAVRFSTPVESVTKDEDFFVVTTSDGILRARRVLLCLGRRGTPRKLGVPGEDMSKVMYRLIDAASYDGERLLIVGGGDSAIEAAMGLANYASNEVTLSYRKSKFFRIKAKNQERIEKAIASGKVRAIFDSSVEEISEGSVRLRVGESETTEIGNDYVFVFAGGVPPFSFLRDAGVRFGGDPLPNQASNVSASPA